VDGKVPASGEERAVAGKEFVKARGGDSPLDGDALWFVFAGREALLREGEDGPSLPRAASSAELGLDIPEPIYIGRLDGTPCMAALLDEETVPPGFRGADLRALHRLVDEPMWAVAGLAFQLAYWATNTRFCPRTGHRTRWKVGEWAAECPACGLLQYPHVSPCVIVLVHDGDRILLTRQPGWPPGRYGLVAGFVEPGETLEQALAREVREETGIGVDDVRYVGSQSWPFPHQLMVGFTARHAGGEIVVDRTELEDAAWFPVDALPTLPPPLSIARRIIDAHVAAYGRAHASTSSEEPTGSRPRARA
jgi:NAD+ diphosphatase